MIDIVLTGWILSLGAITSFISMLVHSLLFRPVKETRFIFIGGTIIAYLLEYSLSIILEAYAYQNIPLTIYSIPIAIPFGWVTVFYSLLELSSDGTFTQFSDSGSSIFITGFAGGLFGLAIETLAREVEFWNFHFSSVNIMGIPIIVSLAWVFSVMIFSTGIVLYRKYERYWLGILILVHMANLIVAWMLLTQT